MSGLEIRNFELAKEDWQIQRFESDCNYFHLMLRKLSKEKM